MAPEPKSIVDISGLFKYSKVHDVSSRHHPKAPKFEHVLAQQFSRLSSSKLGMNLTNTINYYRKHRALPGNHR